MKGSYHWCFQHCPAILVSQLISQDGVFVVLKLKAPSIKFLFVALVKLYRIVKTFTNIFNTVSHLKGNSIGAAELPISPNRTVCLNHS